MGELCCGWVGPAVTAQCGGMGCLLGRKECGIIEKTCGVIESF